MVKQVVTAASQLLREPLRETVSGSSAGDSRAVRVHTEAYPFQGSGPVVENSLAMSARHVVCVVHQHRERAPTCDYGR